MKKIIWGVAGLGMVVLLGLGLGGVITPAEDNSINLATMSQGTVSYGSGAALAQTLLEKGGFNVRVQPNAGSSALIPLVDGNEVDLGIAGVLEVQEAARGENIFVGRPQHNLRAAMVLYPLKTGLWVRADSDIQTIADLKGKRVTAGFNAQKSVDIILTSVLANGGLDRDEIIEVRVPNIIRGADDFIAGRADAFFLAVGAAKVLEADAAIGVRLLPMENSPAAMARMREFFEYAYLTQEVPTDKSTGIFEPTWITTYDMILLTTENLAGERLKEMLTLFSQNKDMMIGVHPVFRGFAVEKMYKDVPVPYHPAAIEWFNANAIDKAS